MVLTSLSDGYMIIKSSSVTYGISCSKKSVAEPLNKLCLYTSYFPSLAHS